MSDTTEVSMPEPDESTPALREPSGAQAIVDEQSSVVDLFAGPGGWDVAARSLGLDPLGVEWDESACATRVAAGLRTVQADVATLTPADFAPVWGLIASPPCQSFSMAGKRGGERDTEHVIACAHELAAGNDTRAEHRAKCEDERSMLVVEPIRWVRDLRPRWVALEQVPPVLDLWSLFAGLFSAWGYRTWTGILSSERYGVPQTRKRAILLASLDFQPHPPEPTHQAYVPGEPQRHEVTMFGEVLPWVSMAQALGWEEGPSPSPSPSVTGGGGSTGGVEVFASKGARERVEQAVVRTNNFTAHSRNADGSRTKEGSSPYERSVDEPSPTVVGRVDLWKLRAGTNANDVERPADTPAPTMRFGARLNDVSWVMRANAQENAAVRGIDEPAPTIKGGHDTGERVWQPTHYDRRQTGGDGTPVKPLPVEVSAPTLGAAGLSTGRDVWTSQQPSPTIMPGVNRSSTELPNGSDASAVRVSVEEAAILQSFPADYPWQGSRVKQFQQIGNAVPPMLAAAVLSAVMPELSEKAA